MGSTCRREKGRRTHGYGRVRCVHTSSVEARFMQRSLTDQFMAIPDALIPQGMLVACRVRCHELRLVAIGIARSEPCYCIS